MSFGFQPGVLVVHRSTLGLAFVVGMTSTISWAQAPATSPGHAYKVAFWYSANQPVESLKYQVYDPAKGQYNEKAIDGWFRDIFDHHPEYGAYIREIRTEGPPGATEAERLNAALAAEKERWAKLQRTPTRPVPKVVNLTPGLLVSPASRTSTESRTAFDLPAPGSPGGMSNPPSSPFPYPYRSGPR